MNQFEQTVALAKNEVTRMNSALSNAEPEAKIHMHSQQFKKLAELIECLCKYTDKIDKYSFSIDGAWVPLAEFELLKRRNAALEQECATLRTAGSTTKE